MDPKIKSRISWFSTLFTLFLLSYWREVVFTSINAIIQGETFFYAKTIELPLIFKLTKNQLFNLKYILTAVFSVLFILITYIGIYLGIKNKLGIILVRIIYGLWMGLTFSLAISSIFHMQFQTIYPYLRILVGWIHSPLIFLFISIVVYSTNSLNKKVF